MNNSKHTPGPWTIEHLGSHHEQIAVHTRGRTDKHSSVCIIHGESAAVPGHFQKMSQRQNADARLIAAAPELLEALENLRDNFDYPPAAYSIILNAIAKATGGSRE